MHFYGMTDNAVMGLPIRRFWLLSGCVDRIMAQKDLRALAVSSNAMSGENLGEHRERLVLEIGNVYKLDKVAVVMEEERDEAGFAELRNLAKMM